VLIDGSELPRRMMRQVGVTTATPYELKRVSSDFFIEK